MKLGHEAVSGFLHNHNAWCSRLPRDGRGCSLRLVADCFYWLDPCGSLHAAMAEIGSGLSTGVVQEKPSPFLSSLDNCGRHCFHILLAVIGDIRPLCALPHERYFAVAGTSFASRKKERASLDSPALSRSSISVSEHNCRMQSLVIAGSRPFPQAVGMVSPGPEPAKSA